MSASVGHDDGVVWALEGLFAIARQTVTLSAGQSHWSADTIRERKGLLASAAYSFHQAFLEQMLSGPQAVSVRRRSQAGRGIDLTGSV